MSYSEHDLILDGIVSSCCVSAVLLGDICTKCHNHCGTLHPAPEQPTIEHIREEFRLIKERAERMLLFDLLDLAMDMESEGQPHSSQCDCEGCCHYARARRIAETHEALWRELQEQFDPTAAANRRRLEAKHAAQAPHGESS